MMHALTVALAATAIGGVFAAQSSSIPSGVSSGCSSFLSTTLDASSSTINSCLTSVIKQTSSNSSASSLDSFCSTTASSCSESAVRKVLTSFYDACSAELTTDDNEDVITIYDNLYALAPMRSAMCSKDDQGKYCVSSMGAQYLNGQESAVQKVLDSTTISADDASKYGIAFAFLNSNLGKDTLCQTCTRKIIMAYTTFETSVAYAPGLALSPLLSSQTAIYKAVQDQCGSDYLSGVVSAAGSLSGGSTDGDGALSTSISLGAAFAAFMAGAITLA